MEVKAGNGSELLRRLLRHGGGFRQQGPKFAREQLKLFGLEAQVVLRPRIYTREGYGDVVGVTMRVAAFRIIVV